MVTVKMKTSGPMNRNSILSINMPEPQSVKNKNNITTIVKNTRNNRSDSLYSQQPFRQPPSNAPQQPRNIQPVLTAGQQNTRRYSDCAPCSHTVKQSAEGTENTAFHHRADRGGRLLWLECHRCAMRC